jgi:hypothetical protein
LIKKSVLPRSARRREERPFDDARLATGTPMSINLLPHRGDGDILALAAIT